MPEPMKKHKPKKETFCEAPEEFPSPDEPTYKLQFDPVFQ